MDLINLIKFMRSSTVCQYVGIYQLNKLIFEENIKKINLILDIRDKNENSFEHIENR